MGDKTRHKMNIDRIEKHLDMVYAEQERLLGHKTLRQMIREAKKAFMAFLRHPIKTLMERNKNIREAAMFDAAEKDPATPSVTDIPEIIKSGLKHSPAVYICEEKGDKAYMISRGQEEGLFNIHEYASKNNARYKDYNISTEQMKSMFRDTPSREMTDVEFMAELTQRMNTGERVLQIMNEIESLPKPFIQSMVIDSLRAVYIKDTGNIMVQDTRTGDDYLLPNDKEIIENLIASRKMDEEIDYFVDTQLARESAAKMLEQGKDIQFPDGCSAKMRGDGTIDVMDVDGNVLPPDLADDIIGEAVISGSIQETRSAPAEKVMEREMEQKERSDDDEMIRTL